MGGGASKGGDKTMSVVPSANNEAPCNESGAVITAGKSNSAVAAQNHHINSHSFFKDSIKKLQNYEVCSHWG